MHIRIAKRSELEWINERYAEIQFAPSCYDNEVLAIAEIDDRKAGLGRLITIDKSTMELGGIYVFEEFRGQGVARKIVEFLLKQAPAKQTIYCIPFRHLISFYNEFGFTTCQNLEVIPAAIEKKCAWCKKQYTEPTAILVLENYK